MLKIGFHPKGIIAIVLVISVSTAAFFGWRSNSDDTVPPPEEIEEYLFWNPKYLKDFTLNAAGNEELNLEHLLGKWSFVFFGYTHCPDICPATLGLLAVTFKSLEKNPEIAQEIQGIFISVDPDRDTQEHMKEYAAYFHPKFTGVTGSTAQVDAITRQMGALYALNNEESKDNYLVSHNTTVFLVDPSGRRYGRFPPPHVPQEIADAFTNIRAFYNAQEKKRWSLF